jgi:hypothetical protein
MDRTRLRLGGSPAFLLRPVKPSLASPISRTARVEGSDRDGFAVQLPRDEHQRRLAGGGSIGENGLKYSLTYLPLKRPREGNQITYSAPLMELPAREPRRVNR